jgi:C4-dicarboxylate-specific signal transduction histidine kinase
MRQNRSWTAKAGTTLGLALGLAAAPAAAAEARIGVLVQSALREAAKSAPAAVSVEVSGAGAGLTVAAAPDAVRRALRDVIEYSARAMARRPTRRLEVRIARDGADVDVEFRDSGPGVTAEDLLAIYGDATTGTTAGSSRDLLADSNRLAQNAGGRLLIDSQEGVGTDFVVKLPIRKGDADAVAAR